MTYHVPPAFLTALEPKRSAYVGHYANKALEEASGEYGYGSRLTVSAPGEYEHGSLTATGEAVVARSEHEWGAVFDGAVVTFYIALKTSPLPQDDAEQFALEAIEKIDYDMDLGGVIATVWEKLPMKDKI